MPGGTRGCERSSQSHVTRKKAARVAFWGSRDPLDQLAYAAASSERRRRWDLQSHRRRCMWQRWGSQMVLCCTPWR
eukprot:492055-Pyramimonas_sp.AAC.1